MRIFLVELGSFYTFNEAFLAESMPKIKARRDLLEELEIKHSYDDKALASSPVFSLTSDQVLTLLTHGQEFTIKSEISTSHDNLSSVVERFAAIVDKAEKAGFKPEKDSLYNAKVNVYTPGAGLMLFNSTMLIEDCCTDGLQRHLDAGWRIISCCPQPDSRRPDYVMGRYNPDHEACKGAKRG